jgi:hypothetical protein
MVKKLLVSLVFGACPLKADGEKYSLRPLRL